MHIPKLQTDRSREVPEMESSLPFTDTIGSLQLPLLRPTIPRHHFGLLGLHYFGHGCLVVRRSNAYRKPPDIFVSTTFFRTISSFAVISPELVLAALGSLIERARLHVCGSTIAIGFYSSTVPTFTTPPTINTSFTYLLRMYQHIRRSLHHIGRIRDIGFCMD